MMKELLNDYVKAISYKFSHKETSELGYRTDFELLLRGIFKHINVKRIAHDDRARQGNKPDFIVHNKDVPLLYIETKDIGISLDKAEKSRQMARYFGYTNLVLTDYVEFRFYRNGVTYQQPIKIADYDLKKRIIKTLPDNYELVAKTLIDITETSKETIKSGKHLAMIMGGKAQRIRDNIRHFLILDSSENTEIIRVYKEIKRMLVHDITIDMFADMYAQTLVYGLFAARYYDDTPETFSRQEARDLVPASCPFLQHFFDHISGPNFDRRLSYIVDELCTVFRYANTRQLIDNYMGGADPVIHFYEDFLKEYDPVLRKKMGAYYTPLPVVRFIVRSVDEILKRSFHLPAGLADTSKLSNGKHRVQILDPAAGTGTFISATIRLIYEHLKVKNQQGRWPEYVHHDLLPRLHGFELMMAPYTIAHLRLGLAFKLTGFWKFNRRLGIYLTNSLEQSNERHDPGFFGLQESISDEAREADRVKRETPTMIVLGNPPYSISSANKGKWISLLLEAYKAGLKEQNLNAISDDYIKFIRLAENFIENNKNGIVAMITNNSFIDGITHRQMRKHLLKTFDEIYILDLHGDSRKKEKALGGSKDENVFNIQQGVSISLMVCKTNDKINLGNVYHADLFGMREDKFKALNDSSVRNIKWETVNYSEPYYFFVQKDFNLEEEYNKGFKIDTIFIKSGSGIKFRKDNLLVKKHFDKESVTTLIEDMINLSDDDLHEKYEFQDTADWKLSKNKKYFLRDKAFQSIRPVQYRPFDIRYTYYPIDYINVLIPRGDSRVALMRNMFNPNISLLTTRSFHCGHLFDRVFLSKDMAEIHAASDQTYVFPLYLYDNTSKTTNLDNGIIIEIEKIIGAVAPEDIFDYIYAVLHSPGYRKKFNEFLRIDFPRVPYPQDTESFKRLIAFGAELRALHLLESPKVNEFITTYPVVGSDTVEKVAYQSGKVFINKKQYFGNMPEIAWKFYIGGYQPAQKWLKDRKGRTLTNMDIEHYQKIIVALTETYRIMKEIDK